MADAKVGTGMTEPQVEAGQESQSRQDYASLCSKHELEAVEYPDNRIRNLPGSCASALAVQLVDIAQAVDSHMDWSNGMMPLETAVEAVAWTGIVHGRDAHSGPVCKKAPVLKSATAERRRYHIENSPVLVEAGMDADTKAETSEPISAGIRQSLLEE